MTDADMALWINGVSAIAIGAAALVALFEYRWRGAWFGSLRAILALIGWAGLSSGLATCSLIARYDDTEELLLHLIYPTTLLRVAIATLALWVVAFTLFSHRVEPLVLDELRKREATGGASDEVRRATS